MSHQSEMENNNCLMKKAENKHGETPQAAPGTDVSPRWESRWPHGEHLFIYSPGVSVLKTEMRNGFLLYVNMTILRL